MAKPIKFKNHKDKVRWQAVTENGKKLVNGGYGMKYWQEHGGTPLLFKSYYWALFRGWMRDVKENRKTDTFREVQ